MKVAVLTWFRDSNYGTVLQAYALQMFLKECGHEAYLINYIPPRVQTQKINLSFGERLLRKFNYLSEKHYTKNNKDGFAKKRDAAFQTIDNSCLITEKVESQNDFMRLNDYFDAFVCGSDQIWNPFWLDGKFFLDFVQKGKLKIAYAPSMGVSSISQEIGCQIGELLNDFSFISVRENSAMMLLRPFVDKNIVTVCDPVFLLNLGNWIDFASSAECSVNEKYIFYYFLSYQPEHWRAVIKFAKKKKLKLVGIPVYGRQFYHNQGIKFPFASPESFVNLINNAEYVLTDSFHATAFSILLKKQFYVFERFKNTNEYSQNSRVDDLLKVMGLDYRKISFRSSKIIEREDLNYTDLEERKNRYIQQSVIFLKHALNMGDV